MLELAILGLLKERPMHGYDLRKRLRDELGPFSNVSFGSLYPALNRLQRGGAVEALSAADELREADDLPGRANARAAVALGGRGTRARKVYVLTERGQLLFGELLEGTDVGDDPRTFLLKLSFARHLSPAARIRLLERRRMQLLDRVERAGRLLSTRRRDIDRYGVAILEHAFEQSRADLVWVERLLEDEDRSLLGRPVVAELSATSTGASASGGAAAGAAGAIAGILHAGRLRRRVELAARLTAEQANGEPATAEPMPASRQPAAQAENDRTEPAAQLAAAGPTPTEKEPIRR